MPTFVAFSKTMLQYMISPNSTDKVGKRKIQVDLIDSMDAKSSYTFDITVKDYNSTDSDVLGFAGVIEQSAEEKAYKNGTGKVKT